MTPLERRYRALLGLLPSSYRAAWEDEMVATFLATTQTDVEDEFGAEAGRPSLAETASIIALAVRLRVGVAQSPRSLLWGDAVRRLALVGLLALAVLATVNVWGHLRWTGWLPWPPLPRDLAAIAAAEPPDVWQTLWLLTGLLWVVAYLGLLAGWRPGARTAAVAALATQAAATLGHLLTSGWYALSAVPSLLGLLTASAVVGAMAGFHRDAPRVRSPAWLTAYAVVVTLAVLPVLLAEYRPMGAASSPLLATLDWPGLQAYALIVGGALYLVGRRFGPSERAPSLALTLMLLAVAVLVIRGATLLSYVLAAAMPTALVAAAVAQTVAVVAIGAPISVLAVRALRQHPPVPTGHRPSSRAP